MPTRFSAIIARMRNRPIHERRMIGGAVYALCAAAVLSIWLTYLFRTVAVQPQALNSLESSDARNPGGKGGNGRKPASVLSSPFNALKDALSQASSDLKNAAETLKTALGQNPEMAREEINPHTFSQGVRPREKDLKPPFIPAAEPRGIREGVGINNASEEVRPIAIEKGEMPRLQPGTPSPAPISPWPLPSMALQTNGTGWPRRAPTLGGIIQGNLDQEVKPREAATELAVLLAKFEPGGRSKPKAVEKLAGILANSYEELVEIGRELYAKLRR